MSSTCTLLLGISLVWTYLVSGKAERKLPRPVQIQTIAHIFEAAKLKGSPYGAIDVAITAQ